MGPSYLDMQKKLFAKTAGHHASNGASAITLKHAEQAGLLFHGSTSKDLMSGILPYPSNAARGNSVVFAGKPWVAVSCTAKWDDNDFTQGTVNHGTQPYMHAKTKHAFDRYRVGGYVYAVSPLTFEHREGLTSFEFVTDKPITPLWVIFIREPLSVMRALGVQLHTSAYSSQWKS